MKTMKLELPEKMAGEIDDLVHDGWFQNKNEVLRAALAEFIQRHRFELIEKFQRDDIAWATGQKGAAGK